MYFKCELRLSVVTHIFNFIYLYQERQRCQSN